MTSAEVFVQQLINGLMLGILYALIAVGFTLFRGVFNIIHFGHGDIFMLGSFIALGLYEFVLAKSGIPVGITLVIIILCSSIIMSVIGVATERLFIKPVSKAPLLISLLVTLGLGITIRESVRIFYPRGADPKVFPKLLPTGFYQIGGVIVRYDNLILISISLFLMVCVYLLINKTKMGSAIRAVAQDAEAAMMMGVDRDKTVDTTFVIGSVLATIAGIMYGLYYGQTMFTIGALNGIKGFSAAVIGGLGNVYGAIVGGLLFGLVETLSAAVLPSGSENRMVFAFIVVLIFLVFRPSGILGEKVYQRV